ncbi:uncharacterized protein [Macrobrachium rosenbergii]
MRFHTCSKLMMAACSRAFLFSSASPRLSWRYPSRNIHTRSLSRVQSRGNKDSAATKGSFDPESQDYVHESIYAEPPIPAMPVASMVFQDTQKWDKNIALECGLTGRCYTYGKLRDMTWRFGGWLQRWSKGSHPTVAILSPNTPEYPVVYFGTIAAGGIITTINATYTPEEVANQLSDSGAHLLVVESIMEPLADAVLQILRRDIPIIVNGTSAKGRPSLQEIVNDANTPFASDMEYNPDRVAILPYSSGTTGKPKGVMLTHRALNAGFTMCHFPEALNIGMAEGSRQEILMGLMPFFHIYGIMVFLISGLRQGAKIVTLPKFDPKTFVSVLKKEKMTVLHTVPPLLQFIAFSPEVTPQDLSQVRILMCGAAPVPVMAAAALKKKAGSNLQFQEAFAMTETLCTHMTPEGGEKIGYCGRLVPYAKAKIVDLNTGASLPPGSEGELCIKAPSLMTGYHNNPEATKETVDENGWLHTGDVAICDEDGYFSVVDRIKELIKVKGLQVAPSELEEILLEHPGVADVGIIGVPDARAGEVPRAYIVPRRKTLSEKEVQSFLENRVAPHKKLAGGVKFVDALPKSTTGKLLRRELKKMAENEP